ncbi:uncharacterized protein LOC105698510 isoform X3 [Orussus abietinus]|uniref:uncharacterized protein LOC105698510 isoform X3 n=1 Tax=Orussus abietinus TaxID=222816 RepID=UPI00062665A5|nr:uncharacterized protein LOC105698510 isoform X3 [Orussus abietinus]
MLKRCAKCEDCGYHALRWSSSATRKIRGSSRDTFIGTNHIHPIGILNRTAFFSFAHPPGCQTM